MKKQNLVFLVCAVILCALSSCLKEYKPSQFIGAFDYAATQDEEDEEQRATFLMNGVLTLASDMAFEDRGSVVCRIEDTSEGIYSSYSLRYDFVVNGTWEINGNKMILSAHPEDVRIEYAGGSYDDDWGQEMLTMTKDILDERLEAELRKEYIEGDVYKIKSVSNSKFVLKCDTDDDGNYDKEMTYKRQGR